MEILDQDIMSLLADLEADLDSDLDFDADDDDVYEWEQCLSYTGEDDDEV